MKKGICVYVIYRELGTGEMQIEAYEDGQIALANASRRLDEGWIFHPVPVEIRIIEENLLQKPTAKHD